MSARSRRRRGRVTRSSARQAREEPSETLEVIDVTDTPTSTCIDLTEEDELGEDYEPVVDLTSVNDSPVVILETQSQGSPSRRQTRRSSQRSHLILSSDSDSEPDSEVLELPPFDLSISSPKRCAADTDIPEFLSPEASTSADTPKRSMLSCPICFDNERRIKTSGRQLHSTVCGHLFCDVCIKNTVQIQKKCPTCRRKLTMKQVHPIFL